MKWTAGGVYAALVGVVLCLSLLYQTAVHSHGSTSVGAPALPRSSADCVVLGQPEPFYMRAGDEPLQIMAAHCKEWRQ